MNGVSMRQYAELTEEHNKLKVDYLRAVEEIENLKIQLTREKMAYNRLKGRMHMLNYTMPNEEFKAIMLDTKYKIMLDYNKDKPI